MPLVSFLYRCPRCGHDPMGGEGDEALCPSCGTRYRRGGSGGRIRVLESSGASWEVSSHRLADAITALGGPLTRARTSDGGLFHRAGVELRRSQKEDPVRYRGELQGFAETLGPSRTGFLELTDDVLSFRPPEGEGEAWHLLAIRAVQTSSSSLQISPKEGGVVQFRFRDDSPRRWEALLHLALRRIYRSGGLGEIREFQPRIRVS